VEGKAVGGGRTPGWSTSTSAECAHTSDDARRCASAPSTLEARARPPSAGELRARRQRADVCGWLRGAPVRGPGDERVRVLERERGGEEREEDEHRALLTGGGRGAGAVWRGCLSPHHGGRGNPVAEGEEPAGVPPLRDRPERGRLPPARLPELRGDHGRACRSSLVVAGAG
jgi:hypothetical protein